MVHNDVPQAEVKIKSPVQVNEEPILGLLDSSSPGGGDDGKAPQSLKKGPWSAEEDALLMEYVKKHGEGNWNAVQKNIGLQRCGKSCRLRWANQLRPNLIKRSFTQEEENLIIKYHAELGNKWARMATYLPGRTDNEIKNFWNTRVKRRQRAGLPIYPPEIQAQVAMKKRQMAFMLMQNQVQRPINIGNAGNDETNYLLRNFDLSLPWQQRQASTFPFKTEHLSTKWYPSYISDHQKVSPQPMSLAMGQANNALIDDMFRESQRPGELFNQELSFEHLSTSGTVNREPLPSSQLPPPSNTEHFAMNPLNKTSSHETDKSKSIKFVRNKIDRYNTDANN
ncbi:Transcription factor GAMYB [Dendrobium catenatum]|uniref:Transcription factor GAMYB n=2 Tax=Dendrobium catenatum TaxID=906689 RepID=A0A2I0VSY0_9ASPA|nr:Transcription factor GAMYB [Dendrobium catenatum]